MLQKLERCLPITQRDKRNASEENKLRQKIAELTKKCAEETKLRNQVAELTKRCAEETKLKHQVAELTKKCDSQATDLKKAKQTTMVHV